MKKGLQKHLQCSTCRCLILKQVEEVLTLAVREGTVSASKAKNLSDTQKVAWYELLVKQGKEAKLV